FFCMLALRQPRHFKTNHAFALDRNICAEFNSPEKHHIFPRHYLKMNKTPGEYLLANFCFIPAELNKEIRRKAPSDYFQEYASENSDFRDALDAQLIPFNDAIRNNDYKEFIQSRSQEIFDEFERLVGSKILQVAGSNANKAIDEIETQLRTLIHTILYEEKGEKYWEETIPSDVQDNTKKKIDKYLRKNPSRSWGELTNQDKLEFCEIMDYSNIILKNWGSFEKVFRSKFEIEKRFIAYKDFRNAVKHNREIDRVLQRDGEAS